MTSCSVSSLPLSLSRQREEEGAEESESAAEAEGSPAAVGVGRSLPSSSNRVHLRPNSSSHRRLQLLLPLHVWALFLLLLCPLFFLLLANSTTLALPGLSVLRMSSNGQQAQQQLPLRVMTFNIWVSGANVHNGMDKIASQILDVDPDIVALQEVRTAEVATNLTQLLGPSKWKSAHHPFAAYPDTAILTKHKFVLEKEFVHLQFERNISDFLFNEEHYMNNSVITYGMIRATIELEPSGQLVNFVSLHLDWRAYGPYAANNKLVTSQKQIMAGERNKQGYGRAQNIEQMLADEGFQRYLHVADQQPLIVAGDFNAPSHLDWTEETKDIHGGWVFEWPSSKLLAEAGFHDSFRNIHPDIKKEPGITWSTVQKSVGPDWDWTVPEPQDRIDLILYKPSAKFRPLHSYTYAGKGPLKPIPEQFDNEWPSDHYAVVTDFAVDEPAAVNGEQKLVN